MKHDNAFTGSQLRHRSFQLQGFVDCSLNKCLDLRFTERRQRTPAKASGETLGAGEPYAIALVSGTVEQLLIPASVIMRINSA